MNSKTVVVPDSLSGSGDQFIDSTAVNEVVIAYPQLFLLMQNDSRITLHPELAERRSAFDKVMRLLFGPAEIDKMKLLAPLMKRWIAVGNIRSIRYVGGIVIATMADSSEIGSRPASFENYRQVVSLVHGADAAAALKPKVPEPIVLEQKHRPAPPPPMKSGAQWMDDTIQAAQDSFKKITAGFVEPKQRILPKVTANDQAGQAAGVRSVVNDLELIAMNLPECEATTNLTMRIRDLSVAGSNLLAHGDGAARRGVRQSAEAVTASLIALPRTESTLAGSVRIREQCARLSELTTATKAA